MWRDKTRSLWREWTKKQRMDRMKQQPKSRWFDKKSRAELPAVSSIGGIQCSSGICFYGKVKYVIGNGEQRIAAGTDRGCELLLGGGKICIQQQARHANDRIHRRANLVTHGGQEGAFYTGGGFGGVTGLTQFTRAFLDQRFQSCLNFCATPFVFSNPNS